MARKKAETIQAGEMIYFVTNQYNLREILSSRFIGSIYSYDDKYYEDLLNECPGKIPLFQQPIDTAILNAVNEHDRETSYAILLEVSQSALAPDKIEFLGAGKNKTSTNEITVLVYQDNIPIKNVKTINFLEDRNLKDFLSRSFSDLPDYSHLFRVSTQYIVEGDRSKVILEELRNIQQIDFPSTKDFIRIDKIGGAITLCHYYLKGPDSSAESLIQLAIGVVPKQENNVPAWMFVGLEPRLNTELAEIIDINDLLFSASVTVLHRYDHETVNQKSSLLKEIEELTSQVMMSEEDGLVLKRTYARTRKYIDNEIDFEPFKSREGYEVSKALLLFLLRPKYEDLLSWSAEETGASNEIMLTALAFAGIVAGRKSINVKYRNTEFEQILTENLLETLKKKKETKPKIPKGRIKKGLSKKVIEPEKEVSSPKEIKNPIGSDSDKIDKKISELSYSELHGELKDIAIGLCKKMQWYDCLISRVDINEQNELLIVPDGKGHKMVLTIKGPVNLITEIDLNEFRQKISDQSLKKQIIEALQYQYS